MSVESMIPSSHLVFRHPLFLTPSIFPSSKVFSNELALRLRWWQYLCFSFSVSPSNEYSGLISSRTDWFNRLVVQGIVKSLLQHHNSKASILWLSAFFMVQLLHSYNTGKNHSFHYMNFGSKVMSLLFNMLPRFLTAFLTRSKYLLISWLQSPSSVILESRKIKSNTVFTFSPFICH